MSCETHPAPQDMLRTCSECRRERRYCIYVGIRAICVDCANRLGIFRAWEARVER